MSGKRQVLRSPRAGRYSLARFLYFCSDDSFRYIMRKAQDQEVFEVSELSTDALAPILILTEYAKINEVDIVDDYEKLLQRTLQAFEDHNINHYDLFFASAILINYENYRPTTAEGFDSIGIPEIWKELYGEYL